LYSSAFPARRRGAVDKRQRDGHAYVLRDVPARVCQQCGEPYFEADVTTHILAQVERASESGVEVAVLTYKAA
jgi:YgiT-type zinc finger domain-containing protein